MQRCFCVQWNHTYKIRISDGALISKMELHMCVFHESVNFAANLRCVRGSFYVFSSPLCSLLSQMGSIKFARSECDLLEFTWVCFVQIDRILCISLDSLLRMGHGTTYRNKYIGKQISRKYFGLNANLRRTKRNRRKVQKNALHIHSHTWWALNRPKHTNKQTFR